MKHNIIFKSALLVVTAFSLNACKKQLNLTPPNSNTADQQYSSAAGYKQGLAKVYGAYSLISSTGTGSSDISVSGVSDVGETDFLRTFWNMQELTTDEAVCAWNDQYIQALHNFNINSSNIYTASMYYRSMFQITVANEFIIQSSDANIAKRGFKDQDAADIRHYRSEARFLRAFQYWVMMDLFANPPFVTDKDPIGTYFVPKKIERKDLFAYIESELKDLDTSMIAPHQNEYARADQAAADALLARMYLNATVYTGTARYNDAITYAQKVINDGYALMPHYKNLFQADNNVNNTEQILSIAYDATQSQNYGGTTFLVCSARSTDVADDDSAGITGGWLGNRSTQRLPQSFADYTGATDKRAMFRTGSPNISDELNFGDGLEVVKFSGRNSDGTTPPSPNGVLVSTDFPLFRLAEMYLVYIESVARGGSGGDAGTAVTYFNKLRDRAYENTGGATAGEIGALPVLDSILAERQHELYWEGFRRTDLIRYGYFTSGSFVWPWKGGSVSGIGVDAHFNLLPLPTADLIVNTNLVQNPGY